MLDGSKAASGHEARSAGEGNLAGLRVVEICDELAEYCGLTLMGLGAEVIKIEPPGGNPTRRIGPFFEDREGPERSLHFWHYNRGKRSLVMDCKTQAGRENLLTPPQAAQDEVRMATAGAFGGGLAWPGCLRRLGRESPGYDA